jgi:hypothetical protein
LIVCGVEFALALRNLLAFLLVGGREVGFPFLVVAREIIFDALEAVDNAMASAVAVHAFELALALQDLLAFCLVGGGEVGFLLLVVAWEILLDALEAVDNAMASAVAVHAFDLAAVEVGGAPSVGALVEEVLVLIVGVTV